MPTAVRNAYRAVTDVNVPAVIQIPIKKAALAAVLTIFATLSVIVFIWRLLERWGAFTRYVRSIGVPDHIREAVKVANGQTRPREAEDPPLVDGHEHIQACVAVSEILRSMVVCFQSMMAAVFVQLLVFGSNYSVWSGSDNPWRWPAVLMLAFLGSAFVIGLCLGTLYINAAMVIYTWLMGPDNPGVDKYLDHKLPADPQEHYHWNSNITHHAPSQEFINSLQEVRNVIDDSTSFVYVVVGSAMITSMSLTWAALPSPPESDTVRDQVMGLTLSAVAATLAAGTYMTGAYGLAMNRLTEHAPPQCENGRDKRYNGGVFRWKFLVQRGFFPAVLIWAFILPLRLIFSSVNLAVWCCTFCRLCRSTPHYKVWLAPTSLRYSLLSDVNTLRNDNDRVQDHLARFLKVQSELEAFWSSRLPNRTGGRENE